jgi:hypothetical protein
MKAFKIKSKHSEFYINYLKAINGPVGLSRKEILVLAEFLKFGEEYKFESEIMLSSPIKKRVSKSLGITSHNLNNIILVFKEKKVILKLKDKFILNSNLIPVIEDNRIVVQFELIREDGD